MVSGNNENIKLVGPNCYKLVEYKRMALPYSYLSTREIERKYATHSVTCAPPYLDRQDIVSDAKQVENDRAISK